MIDKTSSTNLYMVIPILCYVVIAKMSIWWLGIKITEFVCSKGPSQMRAMN